jgi:hypothetical protein
MPQIENVTQFIMRTLNGGRPNGVNHATKTGSNEGIQAPVSKGNEKRKTDFSRPIHPADRLPSEVRSPFLKHQAGQGSPGRPGREVGENQTGKKRPANRKGKRIYTDQVIVALKVLWAFFWYKCGKILAP